VQYYVLVPLNTGISRLHHPAGRNCTQDTAPYQPCIHFICSELNAVWPNPELANSGLWLEEKLKHITMTVNMGIWQAIFNMKMAEMKTGKYILTELKKL
jgi:hypothetical protein